MSFNSYSFVLLFLPTTLLLYQVILLKCNEKTKIRLAKVFLILASCFFFAWHSTPALVLLLTNSLFNYLLCKQLAKSTESDRRRKVFLISGLIINIGLLAYCKYFNFFIDSLNTLFKLGFTERKILLPLGLSFFTFQQIACLIDSYRHQNYIAGLPDYILYSLFFPKVISGPISLPGDLLPQFADPARFVFQPDQLKEGMQRFILGLTKKALLADNLSGYVRYTYDSIGQLNSMEAILGTLAFSLQLYFDFSGYSDMACGLAKMLNFELTENFNSPYKSLNIKTFWESWHISLTRFLTNYLYIPLGGNRKGPIRTLFNIFLVFLVSGFWHGAGTGFIVWGMLHGCAMIAYRIYNSRGPTLHPAFSWILTFSFVNFAWIPFRAPSLDAARSLFKRCLNIDKMAAPGYAFSAGSGDSPFSDLFQLLLKRQSHFIWLTCLTFLTALFILVLNTKNTREMISQQKSFLVRPLYQALLLTLSLLTFSQVEGFIYAGF